jgi:peroxisomal 3,2-trans-enoyl-CoA isomerase
MSTNDVQTAMEEGRIRVKKFVERFITFPKILIGFINGPAIGISVTTLALFDGVYASSSATFALPFIRTAQAPEGCSSFLFPSLMGSLHAKEILLFDRKLTAQEAQQRGLVTRVIDDHIFQQEKDKICQEILSLPKGSLLSSKSLIQRWNINTLKYVNEEELQNLKHRWITDEFAEAILKFMDGRKKSKL